MKKSTLYFALTMFAAITFLFMHTQTHADNKQREIVQIATLGELLQEDFEDNTTVYEITGEVILTFQQNFRNQKYIQDETGAILIDDAPSGNFNPGIITTEYAFYDGITGLRGTIGIFGNMRQFVPTEDPGAATSENNVVEPLEITMEQFVDDFMDYQSRLITVTDISFVNPEGNFATAQLYDITDGELIAEFRTTFFDADYIGTPVPGGPFNITGLPNSRSTGDFLTARFLADFEPLASYDVTFNVIDENDDPINDAVITLAGETNDAGDYVFENVPGGSHPYVITRTGFYTREGNVAISEDVTITVVMVEIDADAISNFPWDEDFENDFPPAAWSNYAYGAGGWATTAVTNSGDQAVWHNFTNGDADSWLVTPQIQLPEDEDMLLKFFQRNNFMADYEYSAVKISTGSGNPEHEEFVEVYEASQNFANYTERIISLAPFAGQVVYIAFVYQGDDAHQWFVDDVVIEEAPEAIVLDNIAQLRQQEAGTDLIFMIAGEVFITHQQLPYRGQMFIQDETAGIIIDDNAGIIVTTYDNYDGIIGLKGRLTEFQNMLQLVPEEDPGDASSTANNIEPVVVTLAELTQDYESMLVRVNLVDFDDPAGTIFEHNVTYNISDPSGPGVIRTPNSADLLDYFGTPVPETTKDLIGVVTQRFDETRLLPRTLADFLEPTNIAVIEEAGFSMYPNPAVSQFTISGENQVDMVRVYNINGQLVMEKNTAGNLVNLDISGLNGGIYIVQVISGNQRLNYKLQVQR